MKLFKRNWKFTKAKLLSCFGCLGVPVLVVAMFVVDYNWRNRPIHLVIPTPPMPSVNARDDFLKSFFRKGAKLAEELVRERETYKQSLSALEDENARLRAQVASDDAIRDLLRKIEQLEVEKEHILRARHEADPGQTAEMGRQGRAFMEEKFSPEAHYRQICALYERALSNRKS